MSTYLRAEVEDFMDTDTDDPADDAKEQEDADPASFRLRSRLFKHGHVVYFERVQGVVIYSN